MAPLRVAIGGLHHETNTFAAVPATLPAFRDELRRGEELVEAFGASHHTVGGFLEACAAEGAEAVPLLYAYVNPCGAITGEAFDALAGELLDALSREGPFDVVLLPQHGAAVSDEHPDADGELLARVRAAVGPETTIGMVLDLHANVTERMIELADVVVGYRENPHRDPRVRGAECAGMALAHARGELRPAQRLVRLPMVVPILGGWTGTGPMREVMEEAGRIAAAEGLISHTVFHGFGYADVAEMGSSVLAVSDGDGEAAARAARAIAQALWERREQLRGDALSPAAAVADAWARAAEDGGPVVLLDVGDNVGGGAPGDSTVLVAEALAQGVCDIVATLCDAYAAQEAIDAGEGAEVELALGRTTPVSVGPELRLRGRVARVSDGRFEDPNPTHGGFRFHDGGPTVRFTAERGPELIVTSRPLGTRTPEQLRAVGIDPLAHRLIVAKGVVAPRAGYEPIATGFVLADTPGVTAADLAHFAYERCTRPLWPLDADAELRLDAAAG